MIPQERVQNRSVEQIIDARMPEVQEEIVDMIPQNGSLSRRMKRAA